MCDRRERRAGGRQIHEQLRSGAVFCRHDRAWHVLRNSVGLSGRRIPGPRAQRDWRCRD
uniref:Uncharacterized protein n=1 Tax=uncultured marine virus TaxID=186617 RepID=A0A0F7KZW2_9VIRU|nr:hypothetical protein [uncultured marine virus]